jgi:hypothetical protein
MRKLLAACVLSLAAACGQNTGAPGGAASDKLAAMEEAVQAAPAEAPEAAMDGAAAGQPQAVRPDAPAASAPMLAYAYMYGVEAPAAAVPAIMKSHEQLCVAAGGATCQVLGASTTSYGEDNIGGRLELRAEPRWLAQFRARIETDADKAGGRLVSNSTTSEDLTRQIIDTEANLRAQITLRDRLQGLLASRPGKLAELLEVERELARVQGQIDSMQSTLAVMRTRVSMSLLTIEYRSAGAPLTDRTFEPLFDAFENFFAVAAASLAAIILFVGGALPWALLIGALAWLALRWRRQRKNKARTPAAT